MIVKFCDWCKSSNDIFIFYIFIWLRHQNGKTPLHIACQFGKVEVVECLIKHGAQMETQNKVSDEW